MKTNIITKEGKQKLKEELKQLIDVERSKVQHELAEARAQGDLSENAEYDAARDKQAQVEGRIREIENILENSKILKDSNKQEVAVGSTVIYKKTNSSKKHEFKIVGTLEADPFKKLISNESPVAQAILGKTVGDKVVIEVINNNKDIKTYKIEILEIK